jgi:ABC-type protease/lipase transport system fused ATPase/permease subunit
VGLARALYGSPALVVLDEPNSNLDEMGERALVDALARLRSLGTTVFIITHRTQVLEKVDQIMALNNGMIQAFAPVSSIFSRPGEMGEPLASQP